MNVTRHMPHVYKVASHSVFQGVRGSPARGIFSVEQEGPGQGWASRSLHFRLPQGKGGLPSFCKWKPHSSERGAFLPRQKDRSESMCFDHSTRSAPERQSLPPLKGQGHPYGQHHKKIYMQIEDSCRFENKSQKVISNKVRA